MQARSNNFFNQFKVKFLSKNYAYGKSIVIFFYKTCSALLLHKVKLIQTIKNRNNIDLKDFLKIIKKHSNSQLLLQEIKQLQY